MIVRTPGRPVSRDATAGAAVAGTAVRAGFAAFPAALRGLATGRAFLVSDALARPDPAAARRVRAAERFVAGTEAAPALFTRLRFAERAGCAALLAGFFAFAAFFLTPLDGALPPAARRTPLEGAFFARFGRACDSAGRRRPADFDPLVRVTAVRLGIPNLPDRTGHKAGIIPHSPSHTQGKTVGTFRF